MCKLYVKLRFKIEDIFNSHCMQGKLSGPGQPPPSSFQDK